MCIEAMFETEFATYAKARLENGLSVIVFCRPRTKSYGYCLSIGAGAKDGKPHLAHLVEHLLFLASGSNERRRTAYANAMTAFDETNYYSFGHVDELNDSFESIARIFQPLGVVTSQVNAEQNVLSRELVEAGYLQSLFNTIHHQVLGGKQLVKRYLAENIRSFFRTRLSSEDCISFHNQYYRTTNAKLAFVSPLPVEDALEKINQAIGPQGGEAQSPQIERVSSAPRNRLISRYLGLMGVATCAIWHNHRVDKIEQRLCSLLTQAVLGGAEGRLFQSIRQSNQLAYGVYVENYRFSRQVGQYILFNIRPTAVAKAIDLLDLELVRLREVFPATEFNELIERCCRNFDLVEESLFQIPSFLLSWNFDFDDLVTPFHLQEAMKKITPEMFAAWAKEFYRPENRNVYLGGQFGPMGWYAARRLANGGG